MLNIIPGIHSHLFGYVFFSLDLKVKAVVKQLLLISKNNLAMSCIAEVEIVSCYYQRYICLGSASFFVFLHTKTHIREVSLYG